MQAKAHASLRIIVFPPFSGVTRRAGKQRYDGAAPAKSKLPPPSVL
jgi:hypothetical protein